MKLIVTADLHIGIDPYHDRDVVRAFAEMASIECDGIVIAGDIFNQYNPLAEHRRTFYDALNEIINLKNVWMFNGNHDVSANGVISALESFETCFFDRHPLTFLSHGLDIVSYSLDMIERMREYGRQHSRLLFTHVDSGDYGSEHEIQRGFVPTLPDDLQFDGLIVSGHKHNHGSYTFGANRVMILYPGSPSRCSHAEEDEVKGFLILDTETKEWSFIPRKYDRIYKTVDVDFSAEIDLTSAFKNLKAHALRVNVLLNEEQRGVLKKLDVENYLKDHAEGGVEVVRVKFSYARMVRTSVELKHSNRNDLVVDYVEEMVPAEHRKVALVKLSELTSEDKESILKRPVLKRIKISNFQSIENLEIYPGGDGSIGLIGKNGSGKTTVFEAIQFALYGTTRFSRNVDAVMDDAESAASVTLDFVDGENELRIERVLDESGSSANVTTAGSVLARGVKEVNQWIVNNFGASKVTFESMIMFDPYWPSIISSRSTDRINNLLEPWNFQQFQKARQEFVKSRSAVQGELNRTDGGLAQLPGKVTPSKLRKMKNDFKRMSQELGELKKMEKLYLQNQSIVERIEEINYQLKRIKVPDKKYTVADRNRIAGKLDRAMKDVNNAAVNVSALVKHIDGQKEKMRILRSAKSGNCPTCDSRIDSKKVIELTDSLIRDLEGQSEEWSDKRSAANKRMRELSTELNQIDTALEASKKIASLKKELIKELIPLEAKVKQVEKISDDIFEDIGRLEATVRDLDYAIRSATESETKRKGLEKKKKELSKELELLNVLCDACHPSGIPAFTMRHMIGAIADEIPEVVELINPWQEIAIRVEMTEDNDIPVYTDITEMHNGRAVLRKNKPGEALSRGQGALVNLIFQMAHRKVLERFDRLHIPFILMDEMIDALDDPNSDAVVRWLRNGEYQSIASAHGMQREAFGQTILLPLETQS